MKQRIDIHADGVSFTETTEPVMLVVKNDSIPACDHIEIKVTHEGVIIERWDETNCRFVHAYGLIFDKDFQDNNERSGRPDLSHGAVSGREAGRTPDRLGDATCLQAWIDLAKTNVHWRN
jgi:hypothetical protein